MHWATFFFSYFLTQFINKKKTLFFLSRFLFRLKKKKRKKKGYHSYIIKRNSGCLFGCFVNCKWNWCVPAYWCIYTKRSRSIRLERVHTHTHTFTKGILLRKFKQRTVFFLSLALSNTHFFSAKWMKKNDYDLNICSAFNE